MKTKSTFVAVGMLLTFLADGSAQAASNARPSKVSDDGVWAEAERLPRERDARQPWLVPGRFKTSKLNQGVVRTVLARAPQEFSTQARRDAPVLSLPMPDGTFARFRVVESPIMEPELAAKFPEIKTYSGQGVDDPTATVRMDVTPTGLHAFAVASDGAVFVDPLKDDSDLHTSIRREDLRADLSFFECATPPGEAVLGPAAFVPAGAPLPVELRTYRLAVAAQGEYTQFHGGTAPGAMAAIVTTINRINSVYERELAIRFVLVANNDRILYTDPRTDPYSTNNNDQAVIDQNQANLDTVIGSTNYDMGHVFNRGNGGRANFGVCVSGAKAKGVTGLAYPAGPSFDVDYVGHEMGHQFSANHTWNGTNGFCAPDQYSAQAAYEPGSGSTIMAYTANCTSDDIQNIGSPFFHSGSYAEITTYTTSGNGSLCPRRTSTGNTAPTVSAGANHTIPKGTPFTLTATGNDPDGDVITYCWEERDLGPRQPLTGPGSADNGSSPLFRWVVPTTNASRTFPKLESLLSNTPSHGEQLPSTQRLLRFRVTARDNRAGGGGVRFADMQLTVVTSAGPFVVTSPNAAVTWSGSQRVTWDVAGTTNAAVRATNINILLSLDGGHTFPITLAANTPNDGDEPVVLPHVTTTQARIKVEAVGNVFFDICDTNFTIAGPVIIAAASLQSESCSPGNGVLDPGEAVTVDVALRNISPVERMNLTVELLATNGVLAPGAPQTVSALPAGGTITNAFTFIVAPTVPCGGRMNATLRFRDDTGDLGTIGFNLPIGRTTVVPFSAANPAVIRPALWSSTSPYPSAIGVSNVPGVASKIVVTLSNMTEFVPDSVDIVLVNPAGQSVLLMSDYPYGYAFQTMPVTTLSFDDDAPVSLRDIFPITSGAYRPTDYDYFPGGLLPPAPSGPHAAALSALHGSNPNGTWKLFVADHFNFAFASTNAFATNSRIAGGWSLTLVTSNTVCCGGNDLLSISAAESADPSLVGERLAYSFTVANRGGSAASGVVFIDTLPPNVAQVSFTSSQGACVADGRTVTCALGDLAPSAAAQVAVTVTATSPGTLTNFAAVSAVEPDGLPVNNFATVLTTVDPPPALSIDDPTVSEGDAGYTNAIFHVTLPAISSLPVTVSFATSNGTATAGSDYVAINGTLAFAPGEVRKAILVPVLGDLTLEPDETFFVGLADPVNAALARATGTGTIHNDETSVSISDAVPLAEGNTGTRTAVFTVTLSPPATKNISVQFVTSDGTATAGSDYSAQTGLLTFTRGAVGTNLAVTVGGDTLSEGDETFFVTLLNPTNASLAAKFQATGVILNDDGLPGAVDHFAWSSLNATQYAGLLFSVAVAARDATDATALDFSGRATLAALGPEQEDTIGTGAGPWTYPMISSSHDGRLQSIFLASEVGGARRLTALALDVMVLPGQVLSNWTIRLKHTASSNYAVAAWEGVGWTMAYQTDLSLTATGWVSFPFSAPFDYDGTNNLFVDFSFNNASASAPGQCRYRNVAGPNRSIFGFANSTLGDPVAWSASGPPAASTTLRLPVIRLSSRPVAPLAPSVSGTFSQGHWTGEALLPEPGAQVLLRADDGDGHVGLSSAITVQPASDTDGDGLPDPWERRYFGSLGAPNAGPNDDADADGASNHDEFLAGTDPTDTTSQLRVTAELSGNEVRVRFATHVGRSYRVERTEVLDAPIVWEPVPGATNVVGTGVVFQMSDPIPPTPTQRFYRVRLN